MAERATDQVLTEAFGVRSGRSRVVCSCRAGGWLDQLYDEDERTIPQQTAQ